MKIYIAVTLIASVFVGQLSGSLLDTAKSFLANPSLMGVVMKTYINLRLGPDYQSPYTNLEEYVKFYIYTRKNRIFSTELKVGDVELLKKSNFDPSKPTYFIIHGYLNNIYMPAIQTPKNALLAEYDCNVIGVDWGRIAVTISYPVAAAETPHVGKYVAEMIQFLKSERGLDLGKTHIIGHSLGAQISGFAGKNLKGLGLARITGLDPALPGFADADSNRRLDASDAEFVDCIYTCAGSLGFEKPICQANYYPNGGKKQPGCPIDINGICSHLRVIDLFSESISSKNKFESKVCSTVPDTSGTNCDSVSTLMGYPADTSAQGIFYVLTNKKSKYALLQV